MKKIISLLCVTAIVLSLAGCGNETESSKKTEEKPQTTTVAAATITTTTPSVTEDENTTTTTTATTTEETTTTTTTEIDKGEEVMLDVEAINGRLELQSGSGITAAAMVLGHYGNDVNILVLNQYADIWASTLIEDYTTPSPWDVIVGDPYIKIAQYWAKPIIDMVNNYAKDKNIDISATDISGLSIDDICNYIDNGKPVIVWGTSDGEPAKDGFSWITPAGDEYTSKEKVRVYVVVGYSKTEIFLMTDVELIITLEKDKFVPMFESVYSQAILIE